MQARRNEFRGGGTRPWGPSRKRAPSAKRAPKQCILIANCLKNSTWRSKGPIKKNTGSPLVPPKRWHFWWPRGTGPSRFLQPWHHEVATALCFASLARRPPGGSDWWCVLHRAVLQPGATLFIPEPSQNDKHRRIQRIGWGGGGQILAEWA